LSRAAPTGGTALRDDAAAQEFLAARAKAEVERLVAAAMQTVADSVQVTSATFFHANPLMRFSRCMFRGRLALLLAAVLSSTPAAGQTVPPIAPGGPLPVTVGTAVAKARVATVLATPGLVAFWDFVTREPDGEQRFVARVPPGTVTTYPLDAANYVRDYWGAGREATYADFPRLGRGPFGDAILVRNETDPDFRPLLLVPRQRLHGTPLDIKGAGASVSVVVWAIRESGDHALAGIWHEGTDLRQPETAGVRRVEPGQRQYALFAGLNKPGSACGHVSDSGAGSFLHRYCLHKCNSAATAPEVPSTAAADVLDRSWHCFAMTFDHERHALTGWLDGEAGDRWLDDPQQDRLLSSAANAWLQGRLRREPDLQVGEDPTFPADQYYEPPEEEPLTVTVERDAPDQRVELREYPYTKVRVVLERTSDGWQETGRTLTALRLNPWWFPHALYAPADADSGGPFTIGRVIHSSRSVGFTGWIGGVAVFTRALSPDELVHLAALNVPPAASQ
jgi:hypothetical protein